MKTTEFEKDLEVTRLKSYHPEMILFGLYPNLHEDKIANAVLEQNEVLKGVSFELRFCFAGKCRRNIVLSADEGSC